MNAFISWAFLNQIESLSVEFCPLLFNVQFIYPSVCIYVAFAYTITTSWFNTQPPDLLVHITMNIYSTNKSINNQYVLQITEMYLGGQFGLKCRPVLELNIVPYTQRLLGKLQWVWYCMSFNIYATIHTLIVKYKRIINISVCEVSTTVKTCIRTGDHSKHINPI